MTTTATTTKGEPKVSTIVSTIAAIIAIIAFIFGITNWGDIQQHFWRQRIVGQWVDEGGNVMRFSNDGTFTAGGLIPSSGSFTFVDKDHLVMQLSGFMGIAGDQVFEVQFTGNTMTWTDVNLGFTYSYTKR